MRSEDEVNHGLRAFGDSLAKHRVVRRWARGCVPWAVSTAALVSVLLHASAAAAGDSDLAATLHPGAIEIGIAGSFVDYEGARSVALETRGGVFVAAGPALFAFELDAGWKHVAELDQLRILCAPSWQLQLGTPGVWSFVGLVGGWSEEWIGSFHQARFPLGLTAGVRLLPAASVATRLDYRWLRLLGDPVRDPSEQQILVGISWLFRNRRSAPDSPTPR